MRRGWIGLCCLVALGALGAAAVAEDAKKPDGGPSLEYRPPKPILPEPKGPTPAPPVTVFRDSFGGFGVGRGSFDKPIDVAFGAEDTMYVLDAGNSRVQMFSRRNDDFILEWGDYGEDERRGQFKNPTSIAVVPLSCERYSADVVLVVDTGNHRIQWFAVPCKGDPKKLPNLPVGHAASVFNSYNGNYGFVGEYGIADGKFNKPLDIAFEEPLADAVLMWVLDAGNERVQRFALVFKPTEVQIGYVDQISSYSGTRGNFQGQVSLAWSREGAFDYLYLLGTGCALQKFRLGSSSGFRLRSTVSLAQPMLDATWPVVAPESGLCIPARVRYDSRKEYVYVLDSGNSMLSIFHRRGNFISALRGADRTFDEPRGFTFIPASGEFALADTGNNIVQKFTQR